MATGCYRPRYRPCSFKGVPCVAIEATSEHGRRGAEGEFPFGERTAYQDLGRAIRTYSISARFDSNRHVAEAAAFIAACESPGPGPLMHPTRGLVISAACKSVRVRDNVEREQGVTYVDATFVEAQLWREQGPIAGQLLQLGISTIIAAARAHLAALFAPGGFEHYRRRAAVEAAQAALAEIRGATAAAFPFGQEGSTSALLANVDTVIRDRSAAEQTALFDAAMHGLMLAAAERTRRDEKIAIFKLAANALSTFEAMPGRAGAGIAAVHGAARTMAAAWIAKGALEQPLLPAQTIRANATSVNRILEDEEQAALALADNRFFLEIRKFRTEAVARLNASARIAPVRTSVPAGPAHPVVAAYALLGDARRHREIEALNCIRADGRTERQITVAL